MYGETLDKHCVGSSHETSDAEEEHFLTVQSKQASRLRSLENAIHTFSYSPSELLYCGYTFFERPGTTVVVSNRAEGTRCNINPVLPRMVNVDRIRWYPMSTSVGELGH